jgi:plasmid stability protein
VAVLTIRNLDEATKARLRIRAAHNGRSMEAEAREILDRAVMQEVKPDTGGGLASRIHRRFAQFGGVELELPPRDPARDPPDFSEPNDAAA